MTEILTALKGTPIPTLLIISGIVFLLLGLSGGFAGKIRVPADRQRSTTLIGGLLVAIGLVVSFVGAPADSGTGLGGGGARDATVAPPQAQTASANAEPAPRPAEPQALGLLAQARRWPVVLVDDFDGERSDRWFLGEDRFKTAGGAGRSVYSLTDGRYRCEARYENRALRWVKPGQDPTTDFFATVDLKLASVPDQDAAVGITFRHRSDGSYWCLVTNTRLFACAVDSGGQVRLLIPWTPAQTLAPGAFNRVSLVGIGPLVRIYLNDIEVGVFNDGTHLSGEIGLVVETYASGVQATAEFDNFEVRRRP